MSHSSRLWNVFCDTLFFFGSVNRKKVMSQRDVPGLTKAAIPVMLQNGVVALSLGTNGATAPANVPKASEFVTFG